MNVTNSNGINTSLQVSIVKDIPQGDTVFEHYAVLKNVSIDPIPVTIRPAGQEEYIDTLLFPGWNPEIVIGIKEVTTGGLQYGY